MISKNVSAIMSDSNTRKGLLGAEEIRAGCGLTRPWVSASYVKHKCLGGRAERIAVLCPSD